MEQQKKASRGGNSKGGNSKGGTKGKTGKANKRPLICVSGGQFSIRRDEERRPILEEVQHPSPPSTQTNDYEVVEDDSSSHSDSEEEEISSSDEEEQVARKPAKSGKGRGKAKKRKTQFRFKTPHDMKLVSIIEEIMPFVESTRQLRTEKWRKVAELFNEAFQSDDPKVPSADIDHYRAMKHFVDSILGGFRKEDFRKRCESGKEHEFGRYEQKLAELDNLYKDFKSLQEDECSQKKSKAKTDRSKLEDVRNLALDTIRKRTSDDGDAEVTPKRLSQRGLLGMYNEGKMEEMKLAESTKEKDRELEKLKLQVEQERLKVEQEKIAMERQKLDAEKQKHENEMKLQTERFELEKAERTNFVTTNQKLIDVLLARLN